MDITVQTPLLVGLSLLLYLIIHFKYKRIFISNNDHHEDIGSNYYFLFGGVLLFAVFAFCTGDYYNAISHIEYLVTKNDINEINHFELVYQYLAVYLHGNYILWRLCVWGGACTLIVISAKRLGVNASFTIFYMITAFAIQYAYARSTLAQSIYFFGLTFLICPLKIGNIWSYIMGVAIILLSPFFHRSMWILVLFTPVIFMPNMVKNNYKRIVFYLVAFGVFTYVLSSLFFALDFGSFDQNNQMDELRTYYSDLLSTGSISELFLNTVKHVAYIGTMYYVVKTLVNSNDANTDMTVQRLLKIYLSIMAVSYVLTIIGGSFHFFAIRLMIMSFIPCSLMMGYLWGHNFMQPLCLKRIISLGFINQFTQIVYVLYCSMLN